MKNHKKYSLSVLLIAIAAIVWYANSVKKISHAPAVSESAVRESAVAPEEIGGVGLEGKGGDPQLNREKNRYTMPLDVADLTVASIIQIPSGLLAETGREKRERWSGAARDYARQQESRGVRIVGYLVRAKEEGRESCNGYSDSLHDYHIWVSDVPTNDKANGLVVEITPRWESVRANWRIDQLERLAQHHERVRVTGWLMWDEEHPDEVGKSRASQWEVHPVTNFEIFEGGAWKPL
ncbi:MAG: hypothetical protein Q8922_09080 [Bacteroidota bacterium]|nr:hypothetical protein [Bacteroidota bacterium]MDP4234283.1 hypothetical protein [Bacteroidota bacterium]MDP4243218.1 hypothetical protein [Bacteroidota bacterium]MDP4288076.1 hypothetical protein [Bacteroidota bacterium]